MRTIVLMPVHQAAEFFNETAKHLYKLDPQPDLYIFTENNSTDSTLELVKLFDRKKEVVRLSFPRDIYAHCRSRFDVIGAIRQVLLQRARHYDPDNVVFLDSDVLVNSYDLVNRMSCQPDNAIVGGPVLRYFPDADPSCPRRQVAALPYDTGADLWGPMMYPVDEVMAVGGSCMRLPRRIIQDRRVNFYPVKRGWSEDFGYCVSAQELGYPVLLDLMLELEHWPVTHGSHVATPWNT